MTFLAVQLLHRCALATLIVRLLVLAVVPHMNPEQFLNLRAELQRKEQVSVKLYIVQKEGKVLQSGVVQPTAKKLLTEFMSYDISAPGFLQKYGAMKRISEAAFLHKGMTNAGKFALMIFRSAASATTL